MDRIMYKIDAHRPENKQQKYFFSIINGSWGIMRNVANGQSDAQMDALKVRQTDVHFE